MWIKVVKSPTNFEQGWKHQQRAETFVDQALNHNSLMS